MAHSGGLGYRDVIPTYQGGYNNKGLFLGFQKGTDERFVPFFRWEELDKQVQYLIYCRLYIFKAWVINAKPIICYNFIIKQTFNMYINN